MYLWCTGEYASWRHPLISRVADAKGGVPQFTVLGDIFIKNHYIVLSYDDDKLSKPKVGIGRRVDVGVVI